MLPPDGCRAGFKLQDKKKDDKEREQDVKVRVKVKEEVEDKPRSALKRSMESPSGSNKRSAQ